MRGVDYPFGASAEAGLLHADGSWSVSSAEPDLTGRTAVVAVGSNAVPAVVHAKLSAAGAGGWVPFAPRELRGLAVAHSAHVSPGGYVPTTARSDPGGGCTLVVSWFDDAQLTALDATEPNYRRVPLPARCGVPAATAYVSRWGVLAPYGHPLAPTTQHEVHRVLADDPLLKSWLTGEVTAVTDSLRSPDLARRVRERLAALDWVRPTGLPVPAGK